jgi:hypothetical protein
MENNESNNNYHNYENQSGNKYQARSGLVPVTATIIKKAEVTQDEQVEYQGVNIIDITDVGYAVDYKEFDNKIKITIYDYTGLLEVTFFNRLDNQDTIGYDKSEIEGKREPFQIFGTVKVYNGKKYIQGAKLIKSNCNYVLYHRANVIHSWLYLTGKLKEKNNLNSYVYKTDEKKAPSATKYGTSSEKKEVNYEEEAVNILNDFVKKNNSNFIKEARLEQLLKKFGPKIKDIINKLIDNNKIIENDGEYEIVS